MEMELGSLGPISPSESRVLEPVSYGDGNPELLSLISDEGQALNGNGSENEFELQEVVTEEPIQPDIESPLNRLENEVTTGDPLTDALYKAVLRDDATSIAKLINLPNDIKKNFPGLMRGDPYFWDFDELNIWKYSSVDKQTYDVNREVPIHSSDLTYCDVTFQGNESWSLLHLASSYAYGKSICLLLVAGADLQARDSLGRTILDVCASNLHKILPQRWDNIDGLGVIHKTSNVIENFLKYRVRFDIGVSLRKDKLFYTLVLSEMIHTRRLDLDDVRRLLDAGAMDDPTDYTCWDTIQMFANRHAKEELQIVLDHNNEYANAALHCALKFEWMDGVRLALLKGANILEKNFKMKQKNIQSNFHIGKKFPLHIAAIAGHPDILNMLLNVSKTTKIEDEISKYFPDAPKSKESRKQYFHKLCHYTKSFDDIINLRDDNNKTSIYYTVQYNRLKCFEILLENGATMSCIEPTTLLHLAVKQDHIQIAERILEYDSSILNATDENKRQPLHIACELGHIDMIFFLLKQGADFSRKDENNITPIHIIKNKFTDSKAFLVEIFDSLISCDHSEMSNENRYKVDCTVFNPNESDEEELEVVQALVSADQTELLTHPLIETYLYLEWQSIVNLYYVLLGVHFFFVLTLNFYITPTYYYRDKKKEVPSYLSFTFWMCVLYAVYNVVSNIIAIQEVYRLGYRAKTLWYILLRQTWMKLVATMLYTSLPFVLSWESSVDSEWGRFLASMVVLCSIIKLSMQISVIIDWGLYMLIFGKLLWKYLKILLFSALPFILAFSLVFMIQLRSQESFDGPIAAISKTTVMLNSEFDYSSIFNATIASDLTAANLIPRGFFLMFMIILPIGFYNQMASNVDNLVTISNIRRLEKQVDFLATSERSIFLRYFKKFILGWRQTSYSSTVTVRNGRWIRDIDIYPDLPKHLKDSIIENVQSRTDERRRCAFSSFRIIVRTKFR